MLGEQRQTQQGRKQREEGSKQQQQQERQNEVQEGRQQQTQKQQVVYEQPRKEEQQDEAEEEGIVRQQQDEPQAPKGGEDYQQETEHRWEGEEKGVLVVGAAVAKLLQPPCSINEIAVLPCSSFSICCGALLRSCSLAPADAVAATAPAARTAAALGEAERAAAVTAEEEGQTGAAPRAAPAAAAREFRRTSSTAPAATATAAAPPTCSSSKVSPAEALAAATVPHKAPLQFPDSPLSGYSSSAATQHRRPQQQQQVPHGQQQQGKQLPQSEGEWRQQREQQQKKRHEGKQQKAHQRQVYEDKERDTEQLQERQEKIQESSRQRQGTSCRSDGTRLANAQWQAGASASPGHAAARSDTHAACPCICVVPAADEVGGAAAAPVALVPTVSFHYTSTAAAAAAAAAAAVGAAAPAEVDAAGQPRWNLMLCSSCVPSVYAAATSFLTAAAATCVRVPCALCESCLAEALPFECPAAGAAAFLKQRALTTAAAAVHKQLCTAAGGRRRKTKVKEEKSEEAAGETGGEKEEETKEGREALLQCAAGPAASQRINATSTGYLAASMHFGAAECTVATAATAAGDGESEAAAGEGRGREAAAEGATAAAVVREAAALTGWMRLALLFNGEFPPALQLARLRLDAFVTAVAVVSLAGSSGLPYPQEQPWKRQQLQKVYMQEKRRQQQHHLQRKQQQQVQGDEHAHLPGQCPTENGGQQEHDQGMENRTERTLNSRRGAPNNSRITSAIIHSSSCSKSRSSSRSSGSPTNGNYSNRRARMGNGKGSGSSIVASTKSSNCGRNAAGSSARRSCSSSRRGVSSSTSSSMVVCWMCSSLAACAPAVLPHRGELQQQQHAAEDALPAQAADGFSVLKAVRLFFLEELRVSALLINQDPKSGVLWVYRRTVYNAAMRALLQLLLCRRRSIHTASMPPRPPGRRSSTINTRSRSDSNCRRSGSDSSSFGTSRKGRKKSSRSSGDSSSRYSRHLRRNIRCRKGSSWSSVGRSCMPCWVNRSTSGSSRLCSSSGRSCVCASGSTSSNCMPSIIGSGPQPGVSAVAGTAAHGLRAAGAGLTTVTTTAAYTVAIPPVVAGAAAVEDKRAPAAIEEAGIRAVATGTAASSTATAEGVFFLGTKTLLAANDGEGQKKQREDREKDQARPEHESGVGENGAVAAAAAAAEEEKGRVAGACAAAAEGADVRVALPVDAATDATEAPVTDAVAEGGDVASVAVKTDQEIPPAAGNARRVRDGKDVLDVFYELLDEELLLIQRQAEQRLHAYHPWEHLARLLPLWREFELSAAALLHADVSGKIGAAGTKIQYAAAHARIHSNTAAASSTVYTSAAATTTACKRAAPSTLPHGSEECAAYGKGVQPVAVGTESYTFSPQSVSIDENHYSESFCVRKGGVPSHENPLTAAVKCTAAPAPGQRCAAESGARLPVDCCHAVVDTFIKYLPYVETVNKASASMHVDVCDSSLCRNLRESSTVDNTEESKRELEIKLGRSRRRAAAEESMRQKGAAAAVEGHVIAAEHQSAAVAAGERKASSAAGSGAGTASSSAGLAAEKEQVAAVKDPHSTVATAPNQEKQQHGSCTSCGSKAVVAYSQTHADADREVRRRHGSHKAAQLTTKTRDEGETDEGDKEGREATEEDKGIPEEGGEETSGEKKNVDALQTRMAEEENIGEGGRPTKNSEKSGKERKSDSGVKRNAKETQRIMEERVDSFLQHQIGMLPQCRAPYHVLARRFYEKMQSCMKVVDRDLSRMLSSRLAAGTVNSSTPARVNGIAAGTDCGVPAPITSPVLSSSPANRSSAALSVAAQSCCLGMSTPARSAVRALPGPTSVAALDAAAAAARTAPEDSDEPPLPICATELHERRYDNDASALLLWQPTGFRARSKIAVPITDSSNDICNSSSAMHSNTPTANRSVFTPHEDGPARVRDNTLQPGQSRQALPAALSPSGETALGWASEKNDAAQSAGVTAPRNQGHLLLQSTSLCAHRSEFSDVIRVQEQLLAQYLGTNYEIIKLFPHFEAPWSGRSDLYTAYLRVWSGYVVNVQRRILLYRPDCRNSLQETRRRPKEPQEQVQRQQQRDLQMQHQQQRREEQQGIVGETVGERTVEPCASREVSGGVAEAWAKCETDEHFQLGTDRARAAVARVKILHDLGLSFGDAVQHHLRYVVTREVKTSGVLVSMRKQVQGTRSFPLKRPGTGEQLRIATRRKGKLAVPESTGGESEAEDGPMTRWLSRHLYRLGKDLDRTIERLRLAARELRDRRANPSPFFSVGNEAERSYSSASSSVDIERQLRQDAVIG